MLPEIHTLYLERRSGCHLGRWCYALSPIVGREGIETAADVMVPVEDIDHQ